MKKFIVLMLGCLLIPASVYAVTVKARVDKTRMTLEDILTLTVSVTDADGDVDTSGVKDFRIISHSTGSSFQWINGKSSHEYTHNFTLSPLRKGSLTIPALTVTDNGQAYHTDPISIQVQDIPVSDTQSRDIFVQAHVNDGLPYVGQQIVYVFNLYYGVQITNPSLQIPNFKDFMVKETDKDTSTTAVVNGREYNVIERQIVLVPLKAGTFEIPPSVLTCDKVVKNNARGQDPFDSFFGDPFFGRSKLSRKVLRTNPLTIQVNSLPANPHDVDFSGLIGQITLTEKLENHNLKVGDSTTLTVTIGGIGNIMDAEEPSVAVPEGFKMYKDNPEENIKIGPQGYSGSKVFSLALVAIKDGSFTLPPMKINYFDVAKGSYEILTTSPMELTVAPSDQPGESRDATPLPENDSQETNRPLRIKNKVEYTGHDILPLKESLDGVENRPALTLFQFFLLLSIPAMVAAMVKMILVYTGRGKSRATLMAKRAEIALKAAGKSGSSDEEFLSGLYRAFISMVFSRASMTGETLTTEEVRQILTKAGLNSDTVQEAQDLLNRIESIRFSGGTLNDETRKEMMEKTRQTIRRIR